MILRGAIPMVKEIGQLYDCFVDFSLRKGIGSDEKLCLMATSLIIFTRAWFCGSKGV